MKVQKDHLLKPESRTFRPGIAARQNQVKLQKAEEMLREVPQTMQRPCRDASDASDAASDDAFVSKARLVESCVCAATLSSDFIFACSDSANFRRNGLPCHRLRSARRRNWRRGEVPVPTRSERTQFR